MQATSSSILKEVLLSCGVLALVVSLLLSLLAIGTALIMILR